MVHVFPCSIYICAYILRMFYMKGINSPLLTHVITPESPLAPPVDQEASGLWIRDWCSLCCSALRLKNSERKPCLEKNLTAQKNAKTYYKSVEFNQFVNYLNERTKPNPAFCHHMFPFEFYLRVFGRLSHTCARTGSLPAD